MTLRIVIITAGLDEASESVSKGTVEMAIMPVSGTEVM